MRFITLQKANFLAMCRFTVTVSVSVCLPINGALINASFNHVSVSHHGAVTRLSTTNFGNFFFSYMKRTKLKLLEQVHLPSNGKATYRFRRAILEGRITAIY